MIFYGNCTTQYVKLHSTYKGILQICFRVKFMTLLHNNYFELKWFD